MKINDICIEKVHGVNLGNLVLEAYLGKLPEVVDGNVS